MHILHHGFHVKSRHDIPVEVVDFGNVDMPWPSDWSEVRILTDIMSARVPSLERFSEGGFTTVGYTTQAYNQPVWTHLTLALTTDREYRL